MQLSRESLPLSGRFNGWESCYLHPEKGYVEEQFGAGGSLERGRCKYQVSRESVSSTWLVGWESWYLPLPACFAKVRLLFVVLFINLGAETIFQLTRPTKPWFHCVSGCYCANIQPKKCSHSENIHSRKIFTPEKHSALIMHKLCLCLCLFHQKKAANIIFQILEPPAVDEYSIHWVLEALCICHCLCICVFVFVFVFL